MADFLLRNIDDDVMDTFKRRAQIKGHSLQQELAEVIRTAARPTRDEILRLFEEFDSLGDGIPADVDIVELIREEREGRGWR
ncbi:hypothetical protein [uncultured Alsobacter sp.]|uniref:FitA-like ribbon-helix-helix domain-containing protein n=1 Tax=uncultured Alsobacter sp. TaxID=1748258 RepID=UPI0025DEA8AC|nr:hypothetical protein [uncultured Alsobacter sp.]